MSVNLRQDLAPRAPVTATARHGDPLEILERRRRFVKVRTRQGAEGWTDGRQLLSPGDWERLERAIQHAARFPSQGKVTPFDLLNVHIAPNRQAPSFTQIGDNITVDLIGRAVTPRVPYEPGAINPAPTPPTALKDDWAQIRLPDGRPGWVLSRMLMMNLPDEVTQFAEGHRITSYFPLGTIPDRGGPRHHYLWTTVAAPPEHFQFDSFRVFAWNPLRKRYETTHRERNLRGFYPVVVEKGEGAARRIHLVTLEKDGSLYRRSYEFTGYHVRLAARVPWKIDSSSGARTEEPQRGAPHPHQLTRWERVRESWKRWWNR